jgi:nitrile hydratase
MTDQFAYPPDREEASAKKVAALEALLIEKGVITPQTVDKVLAYFETEMTPLNGKKIVVKAWTDEAFAKKVVVDTPAAIACWRSDQSSRSRPTAMPQRPVG